MWDPTDQNACILSNWTEDQFLNWEIEFCISCLSKKLVINVIVFQVKADKHSDCSQL